MACHVAAPRAYHEYRARSQVGELIQKDSNYPTTSNMLAVMLPDQKPAIRLAREEELREAGTIVALSFESFRAALPPHILEPYMADASDLTAVSEEAQVVVAERGGELAGTVTYYEDAGREGMGWPSSFAGLRTLAVSTSVQGRGVGRALCEWSPGRAAARATRR